MPFRKERDRLKDIDSELSRIKKDLLHIDKSLKNLSKAPAPEEPPKKVEPKPEPPKKKSSKKKRPKASRKA